MAQVPEYGAPTVADRPVTDAKLIPAQGYAEGAAAIAAGGRQLAGGIADAAAYEQGHRDMLSEAATKQSDVEYLAQERQTLYDPTSGYLTTTKGEGALNQNAATSDVLKSHAQELIDKAGNQDPQTRRMVADLINRRLAGSLQAIDEHAAKGHFDYLEDSSNARIIGLQDHATTVATVNPQAFAEDMAHLDGEFAQKAQRNSWDADITNNQKLDATTQIHLGVVTQLLNAGDAAGARQWLLHNKPYMTPKAYEAATHDMEEASANTDAFNSANGVVASGIAAPGSGAGVTGVSAASRTTPAGAVQGRTGDNYRMKPVVIPAIGVNGKADAIRTFVTGHGGNQQDAENMVAIGMVESGLRDVSSKNRKSMGYFQFQADDWAALGGGDIHDLGTQIDHGWKRYQQDRDLLGKHGIAVNAASLYLLHQQGVGGGPALLTAPPETNAIAALEPVYERAHPGHGEAWARSAIRNNGGTDNTTAGEFVNMWTSRVGQGVTATHSAIAAASRTGQSAPGSVAATGTGGIASVGVPPRPDWPTMRAMAMAAAGPNVTRQQKFITAYRAKFEEDNAARDLVEKNAEDAVQTYIRPGSGVTSVSQIPQSVLSSLAPTTLTAVMNHFAENGQFAKTDDAPTLTALHELMVDDPKAFGAYDPTPLTGKLTQGTYQWLLNQRDAARKGTGDFKDDQITSEKVLGVSKSLLESERIGFTPQGKAIPDPRTAQFTVAMLRQVDAYKRANGGKVPNDEDITRMADALILQGGWVTGEPGHRVRGQGYNFQAPANAQYFRFQVPDDIAAAIRAEAKQAGMTSPSMAYIGKTYAWRKAHGFYP